MTDKNGAIAGAIPDPLLTQYIAKYGFVSIQQHIRSVLTSSSTTTINDPRYITFCYYILTNPSVNHSDTRLVLNRGLTTEGDDSSGLHLRCKNGSALLELIDSKKW